MAKEIINEASNIEVALPTTITEADFNANKALSYDVTRGIVGGKPAVKLSDNNDYVDGRLEGKAQDHTSTAPTGIMCREGDDMLFAGDAASPVALPNASLGAGIIGGTTPGEVKLIARPGSDANTNAKLGSGTAIGGTTALLRVRFNGS